jgi:hypothetical protein
LDNIRIEIVDIPASIPEPVFSPWLSLGIVILLTSNALPKQR